MNHSKFSIDGSITVSSIGISLATKTELESHLLLFFTGMQRTASKVAATYVQDLNKKKHTLERIKLMVKESISILECEQPLGLFGQLLNEAWQLKRSLSPSISSNYINSLYESVIDAGAIDGKITGAGGGGFLLVFAEPDKHKSIREKLKDLLHVPFSFESSGSHIL